MCRILTLAFAAVLLGGSVARAQVAVVYKSIDGNGGQLQRDNEGEVNEMGRGWNDEVSSVWVGDGYQFEGYEAINFQGAKFSIVAPRNGSAPQVSQAGFTYRRHQRGWLVNIHKDGWNDILSSYKVQRTP